MSTFGRKPIFGRKSAPTTSPASGGDSQDQKNLPGHQAVLRHLSQKEQTELGIRERVAGGIVFDLACQLLKDEKGVRVENLLAMLASVGGQQCIAPIIEGIRPDQTTTQVGLVVAKGKDGVLYFFGDGPNRLLVESPDSLISLAFGATRSLGATVTAEMIGDEMHKVASRIGGPEFEQLDLPPQHMVDRPTDWARVFTPKIVEALDLYDVPAMRRATVIGYALCRAIEAAKGSIDPLVAARIVLQCATRAAKVFVG
jgi:hypothetical protein